MHYKPKGFSIAAAAVSLTLILPGVVPVTYPQAVAQTASAPATAPVTADEVQSGFFASGH